jgi:hypothetical protein
MMGASGMYHGAAKGAAGSTHVLQTPFIASLTLGRRVAYILTR